MQSRSASGFTVKRKGLMLQLFCIALLDLKLILRKLYLAKIDNPVCPADDQIDLRTRIAFLTYPGENIRGNTCDAKSPLYLVDMSEAKLLKGVSAPGIESWCLM